MTMSKALSRKTPRAGGGDAYLQLVRAFPLRPIRSEADYRKATRGHDEAGDKG